MHPKDLEILIDVTRNVRGQAHQFICDSYGLRMAARGIRRDKIRTILEAAASVVTRNLEAVTPETMAIAFGDLIDQPPSNAAIYLEICDRLRGEAWSTWSQAIEYQMGARGIRRQMAREISAGAERDARARYAADDAETIREHYPEAMEEERTA